MLMGAVYHYHTEQTIKTLRATAEGKTPYEIKEPGKLTVFASRLGLDIEGESRELAIRLCDFVTTDFSTEGR